MKRNVPARPLFLLLIILFFQSGLHAQFLLDMIDTTQQADKGLWAVFKKADHLQISGYMQPQFQFAGKKGARTYSGGGDFSRFSDNRFILRRGRLRVDYAHFTPEGLPQAQLVFQIDGSERGLFIRDFWGRYYENKWQLFSFTAGMFARPFGYELTLGSSDRESPERGRMSQILMKAERDLGVMASFEPRLKNHPLRLFKLDLGLFNGQGLTGPEEYDSYKDVVMRISLKPWTITKNMNFSAGVSGYRGGFVQNSKYLYKSASGNSQPFTVDSSVDNIGKKAPRRYHGFDGQLKIKNSWGSTQLRAEYWWGVQTSSADNSETPGLLLNTPYYTRNFNGAFFYLLQNIVNEDHQVGVKYDWYDPNRRIAGSAIRGADSFTHPADIKFSTVSVGYNYYLNRNIKLMFWYDIVRNEKTLLPDYDKDIKDNIFTSRIQFRF